MSLEELKYFFSYARNDSEFVLKLAKELRAVGANLWLDQLDILGGQHWDSTVEKGLKNCKGMIAVLSPESVASDNVMDEVSYALNEGKLVVPVLIRPCNIPYRLQRVQYIDFTADYDTGFSQLLRALGIVQPLQPVESTAAQEPVVRDSTEPLEEKPTEPLVLEKQAAQELEKPIPDEIDHAKPTGLETEKAWSKSQKTKVLAAICIVTLIVIVSIVVFLKKTYELEISSAAGGSVTKSPDQTRYNHGEKVALTAVADPGYSFTKWLVDDLSDSNNPAMLVMDADKSVTANFVLKTYSLTATADDGSVEKSPDKTSYEHGETVTLEAVAKDERYSFSKWSGDLSDSNSTATLEMDADKSVKANFALKTYSLTATADPNGSITKDPNKPSYNFRETVKLEAVPKDERYSFTKWSGDLSDSNSTATLEMDADKSVKANFALKTYSLTATADPNGSVTKSPDRAVYEHGETVTLEADPNTGYSFTNWSDDLSGSTNPATLEMYADKSVTASFALKTYSLTATADPKGSVTKDPDKTSYNHGDEVTLKAEPNEGYVFSNWSGDLSGSTNPATLEMYADKSVTASFALKTYSLTVTEVNGVVTKSPDKASYNHGETVTLEADPNIGYSFTKWSGDLSGSTNPDTLVMDADKSVTASFDVWEFCSDCYEKGYYSKSPSVDPKRPSSGGSSNSLRGGSWGDSEVNLRCTERDWGNPAYRYVLIGFRVVRSQ